jgi:hypothetical protein
MLIYFENISHIPLKQLPQHLINSQSAVIKNLRFSDVAYHLNQPLFTGHGLYIIIREDIAQYVGMASSKVLVERIAGHFDYHPKGWMNSFVRLYARANNILINEALVHLLDMSIMLINVSHQKNIKYVGAIERALKVALDPRITSPSKRSLSLCIMEESLFRNVKRLYLQ